MRALVKLTAFAGLSVWALSLSGCLGEEIAPLNPGNVPGDSPPPPGTIDPRPERPLKRLRAGDIWTYRLTGSLSKTIQKGSDVVVGTPSPITGTMTILVSGEPYGNVPGSFKITERLTYTDAANNATVRVVERFVVQDADGRVIELARRFDNQLLATDSGAEFLPGSWERGVATGGTMTFQNDPAYPTATASETVSLSVLGPQNVFTPAGSFAAWLTEAAHQARYDFRAVKDRIDLGLAVEVNTILDREEDQSTTSWWAPEIGSWVRRQQALTTVETIIDDVQESVGQIRYKIRTETTYLTLNLDLTRFSVSP